MTCPPACSPCVNSGSAINDEELKEARHSRLFLAHALSQTSKRPPAARKPCLSTLASSAIAY